MYNNYDREPEKIIRGYDSGAFEGYENIISEIGKRAQKNKKTVLVLDFYPGVDSNQVVSAFKKLNGKMFDAESCIINDKDYNSLIKPFITDDRVFGVMNTLTYNDIFVAEKVKQMQKDISENQGLTIIYGVGASLISEGDILIYFDLARWERQLRFGKGASNWKTDNGQINKLYKFKQGFFVEWRMADRHKRTLFDRIDYLIDTCDSIPKMVCGEGFRAGLKLFASEPFRLVPYFAPEVWGGQWMKEVCGLDKNVKNYAWAFDGVPEENSIFMRFGKVRIQVPSIDIVFYQPVKLLGNPVHARFGDEFPIRFDFLDTMQGENLSLQVHPLTEYIQNTFGMHYTQDESYYILDCEDDTVVYLGLKDNVDKEKMLSELELANIGEIKFDADKYVNKWQVKKHDHFLIPAGTIHCSGSGTMVLEISATPYIFTFKLWDWSRLGLDGLPRPTHIKHGKKVIQWDRTTDWVKDNLINQFKPLYRDSDVTAEHTGLHEREFIETRRYDLSGKATFSCEGSVSMCNVVSGEGVVIESVDNKFEPYTVHYAETFIVPADVTKFTIRPLKDKAMVIRASVRV